MRSCLLATALLTASCASAEPAAPAFHLIPGAVPLDKGPDGNSIILDAPDGLIVVDTGRHPEHSAKILAYARERGRPIAAIVNTHWHLDHTTGNWDIRQAYPQVQVLASDALEGALATYLKKSRDQTEAMLADPKTSAMQRDQIVRARSGDRPARPDPPQPRRRAKRHDDDRGPADRRAPGKVRRKRRRRLALRSGSEARHRRRPRRRHRSVHGHGLRRRLARAPSTRSSRPPSRR